MVFELDGKVFEGSTVDTAIRYMVSEYKKFNSEFVGGNIGTKCKTPYYCILFKNNSGIENLSELVEIFQGLGWFSRIEKIGKYNQSTVLRFYPSDSLYHISYDKTEFSLLLKGILGFIADKVSDKEYYDIARNLKEYYA